MCQAVLKTEDTTVKKNKVYAPRRIKQMGM